MKPGRTRIVGAAFNVLPAAGAAGTFVFGILAGEGGRDHLRNMVLGVTCATVPLAVGVAAGFRSSRRIRVEIEARNKAEREAAMIQAEMIFALRARLSAILHLLGTMATGRQAGHVSELLGRLTQAVVAAAVVHPNAARPRRTNAVRFLCPTWLVPMFQSGFLRTEVTKLPLPPRSSRVTYRTAS